MNLLTDYLVDTDVKDITREDLKKFFGYLQYDYVPNGKNNKEGPLSGRSRENIRTATRSFFRWAEDALELKSGPDPRIPRPKYRRAAIHPFTDEEVSKLLKSCLRTAPAKTTGHKSFTTPRPVRTPAWESLS
jgi:site-specific recombinase XerD